MRWIIGPGVSSAVIDALKRHEQTPMADLPQLPSDRVELLRLAQSRQLDIVTADPELARMPFENGVAFSRVMVFLQLRGGEVEQDDAIDRLFTRYKRLTPGRLYTVTETRVKIRQLPKR